MIKNFFWLLIIVFTGCSKNSLDVTDIQKDGAPDTIPVNVDKIPDAVPRFEPRSRSSNPDYYEVLGKRYSILKDDRNYKERGIASWYGTKFHGKKTSNGEVYDMYAMTAAHKTLPIPSYVRVTNLQNGHSAIVRVNDRGPFHANRIIDLSYVAAIKLGIQQKGTGFVEVVTVSRGKKQPQANHPAEKYQQEMVYLQAGAFSSQQNALALKQRINAEQPVLARIISEKQQGKMLYKLQLGPITSAEHADRVFALLTKMGLDNSHFITEKTSAALPVVQ